MRDYETLYLDLANKYESLGYDESKFYDEFPLNHVKMLEFLYEYPNTSEIEEAMEYGYLEELVPSDLLVDINHLEEKFKLYKRIKEYKEEQPVQAPIGTQAVQQEQPVVEELPLADEEDGLLLDDGILFDDEESTIQSYVQEQDDTQIEQQVQEPIHFETEEPVHEPVQETVAEQKADDKLSAIPENIREMLVNIGESKPSKLSPTGKNLLLENGIVYCLSCTYHIAQNGNAYLNFTFKDVHGKTISGKQFGFKGEKTDCANFICKVCLIKDAVWDNYQGTPQLRLNKLSVITDESLNTYNLSADLFVESNSENVDLKNCAEKLLGFIQNVEDEDYKRLLDYIFVKKRYVERYLEIPAGIKYHHTGKGYLLQHVVEVAQCCMGISSVMPYVKVDLSLVITGALLHDIGKVLEMPKDGRLSYTEVGAKCGHITLGTMMVTTMANEVNLPYPKLINLLSLIATHHGSKDKGSPIDANSPDAVLLNLADEASAQLNHVWLITKDLTPNSETKFEMGKNYVRLS